MEPADQLDVAFMLGAGASAEAGIPTVGRFVPEFSDHLHRQGDTLKNVLVQQLNLLIAAMTYGCPQENPSTTDNKDEKKPACIQVNLETVYQVLFHNNRMPGLYAIGLDVPERCREMKGRPYELLEFELKKYVQYRCSRVRMNQLRYLLPLLGFVRPKQWLDIFTLNYDLCVEAICAAKGVVCETGFEPSEVDGSKLSTWRPEKFTLAAPAEGGVRLYKLHGSVSWLEPRPGCFEARPIAMAGPARTIRLLGHTGANEGMLIYPALLKHVGAPPFLDLFHAFWDRLKTLDLLFACGFSFSGDDHVTGLLARGMQQNSKLKLALVDLNAEAIRMRLLARKDFATLGNRVVVVRREVRGESRQTFSAVLQDGWLRRWSPEIVETPQQAQAVISGWRSIELPGKCRRPICLCMDEKRTVYLACEVQGGHEIYRTNIHQRGSAWELVTNTVRTPRDILFDPSRNALLVVSGGYFRYGSPVDSLLRMPSDGFGRLWAIDASTCRVRHLTGLGLADWFSFWKAYTSSDPFKIDSLLWGRPLGMLRWSSRMVLEPGVESVLVVEARRISRVNLRSGRIESLHDDILDSNVLFNISDIAPATIEGVYWLLEGGVANISRHPRIWRFNINGGKLENVDLDKAKSEKSKDAKDEDKKHGLEQVYRLGSDQLGRLLLLLPSANGSVLKRLDWPSLHLVDVPAPPFRATHFCRSADGKVFVLMSSTRLYVPDDV